MTLSFNKYQGTGNDFIIIDNRNSVLNPSDSVAIKTLCERRTGIGADGLILIEKAEGCDFRMIYFNSDGLLGSMCGNGGRCAADFAIRHGIAARKLSFMASDGLHHAESYDGKVRLSMSDVSEKKIIEGNYFINTGSPHYVIFAGDPDTADVINEGRRIRWSSLFPDGGTNVNFVKASKDHIYVRTYERGVEAETLSCGTGVTASAIAAVLSGHFVSSPINIRTRGGNLMAEFDIRGNLITNIWLTGPATFVFEGKIEVQDGHGLV